MIYDSGQVYPLSIDCSRGTPPREVYLNRRPPPLGMFSLPWHGYIEAVMAFSIVKIAPAGAVY